MATTGQVEAYSNGLIARGVVPDRMINSGRSRLAFILAQGYQNEHQGQLPRSDAEFLAWTDAPYWQNAALRRHWPAGSVDVKTDGSRNAPPWDWQPMGWPDGNGGNMEDYQNRTPWPDVAPPAAAPPSAAAGAPPAASGSQPAAIGGRPAIPAAGGLLASLGLGNVDTKTLTMAGVAIGALGLILRRR